MSLVSLALRVATVRVLRDATYAGSRVHDSTIDPVSFLETEPEPFIIVAVDSYEGQPTGRDLLGTPKSITLLLDMAVGSKMKVRREATGEDDDEPVVENIAIPHTDEGLEVTLDLMARQVHRALLTSASPWAHVWRTLAPKIEKVQSDRGAGNDNGVRFATRQVTLTVSVMHEPSFGKPEGIWTTILDLMNAEPELKLIAELLEAEIATPNLEGWQRAIADLGLRDGYSLGGEPLLEGPPQPVTGATVETNGGSWLINEQTIEEALGPKEEP